ncbi:MAG: hypothetical protein AAFY34_16130 [Pseudomonadota bacterium]
MIVSTIGILGAMACEGCTFFVMDDYDFTQPPRTGQIVHSPSSAMLLAAPGPLGTVTYQPVTPPPLSPHERIDLVENILIDYGVVIPERPAIGSTAIGETLYLTGSAKDPGLTFSSAIRFNPIENTDWSSNSVLRIINGRLNAQRLSGPNYQREAVNAELAFSAPSEFTGLNFDIGVVPRASVASEGDFSVRRIGAEFRVGQDIDQRGSALGLPSWYIFAGADGEALIFNNNTGQLGFNLGVVDGLQLRDQVTVGDIQAGLNVRHFGTNFAFSYIRREVEYELGADRTQRDEDFGGLTISWRR